MVHRICALILILAAATSLNAQSNPGQPAAPQSKTDPDRQRATELFNSGKFVEAMPLFEKLAAAHPNDAGIKRDWAFSVAAYAATLNDPELRKKGRIRARNIAQQAQKQGDNSPMVQLVLQIPTDGSEVAFSQSKEVDQAMKTAEANFARGDLDKAREGYLQALVLEPKNYEATLYVGDVYFKQHNNGSAAEWFSRAAQLDPTREAGYRYWGDALSALGKSAEAREQYINAIIAEPYTHAPWSALAEWAKANKTTLNWFRIQDRCKIVSDQNGVQVMLDQSLTQEDPMFKPWVAYCGARQSWQKEKFKQHFPNEAKYRHTLQEEVDALHLMAQELEKPGMAAKLDPTFASLVQVDQAGFLEPYSLLNRPDQEIAQDYAPYRAAHRDTLYHYFNEYVVPKAP